VRDEMAYRIATDVAARISPPPPPGVPPQYVLAAVLAERHRRELARLRPTVPPPGYPLYPPAAMQPPLVPVAPPAHPGTDGFVPPS
jgi:hypothetical protein